jgi:hypothetical protein
LGGPLTGDKGVWYDEFSCLNVTISVPRKVLEGKRGEVSVIVQVHSGWFVEGSYTQGVRGKLLSFLYLCEAVTRRNGIDADREQIVVFSGERC